MPVVASIFGGFADFPVAGPFGVDAFGAVLGSGVLAPRLGWALGALAAAVTGAVGRHRVGNSSRLPGWVV
jgi:hypothetical protein